MTRTNREMVQIFLSEHSVLDKLTKMRIGTGKERGGLYYLEGTRKLPPKSEQVLQVTRDTLNKTKLFYGTIGSVIHLLIIQNVYFLSCFKMFQPPVYDVNNAFLLRIIV
ncbi:hypothetical protein Nepgr_024835 [Nepenthes gracilis]|uniref:Uncharacterized protein n=1 Tax=Nepenthes gracilis TaxID=150966 RepID=A0AAD3XZ00_NEPGR|nr:hypothetical protein Nepgr_024835 [Nepenthes gracilis]